MPSIIQPDDEELIREYFSYGYTHSVIHYIMQKRHGLPISFEYMKRKIFPRLGLYRRGLHTLSPVGAIVDAICSELNEGPARCMGANDILYILRTNHRLCVNRQIVRDILQIIDPEGIVMRRTKRLQRRQYRNKGPNYVWHIDGYDKLSPYGLYIHGCIDGFSRKLIWLRVGISNHDPRKVAAYFIDSVESLQGCPRIIRSDYGTENGEIAASQALMRQDGLDDFANNSYWFGSSINNQRIERWWGLLRQKRADWWINHFKELLMNGILQIGNKIHTMCTQFCYLALIQSELNLVMSCWNHHRIRRQRNGDIVSGIPDILYNFPELLEKDDCRDYLHAVNIREDVFQFCKSRCDYDNDVDNDFKKIAEEVCESLRLNSIPSNAEEASTLLQSLIPVMEHLVTADE